jgi:hypothetical protein
LILRGGYQSGKTTALAALRRARSQDALILNKDFATEASTAGPQTNILHWIMRTASWSLREHLSRHPELIPTLSRTQREFLRWSIEKFHQTRAFTRWLDGLPAMAAQELHKTQYTDLYPTQTITYDVQGQIEELVNLCTRIGFEQVLITVDLPPFPEPQVVTEINNLLGWLEPMQHPQLQLALALPPNLCTPERLQLTRGRAKIIDLSSSEQHTQDIMHRYLDLATNGRIQKLEELCNELLHQKLETVILREFDHPSPGAWIKLIKILLNKSKGWIDEGKKLQLDETVSEDIVREYYRLHLPLRVILNENRLGVWRGYKWIQLDRSRYDFLMLLFSRRGRRVNHNQAQTTKSYLHTLARRLRVAIEPYPSRPIYLQSDRGEGYWLEHFK